MKGRSSCRIWIAVRPGRSAGFATRTRISPGARVAANAKPDAVAAASARSVPLPATTGAVQEGARELCEAGATGAVLSSPTNAIA